MNKLITTFTVIFLTAFALSVKAGDLPKPSVKTILLSGKIQDSGSNELLAGVKITCDNCHKVVYSGLDGQFLIYLEVETTENLIIEFSQVGYSSKTIPAKDLSTFTGNLDINLESE